MNISCNLSTLALYFLHKGDNLGGLPSKLVPEPNSNMCMYVCVLGVGGGRDIGFPNQQAILRHQQGVQRNQLNYDTIYPERASDSTS